jgi:putative transcriptional regulator
MTEAHSLRGQALIAMPNMGDPRFEKSLIYICAHSSEGAMGFMVNRTLDRPDFPDFLEQLGIITEREKASLPTPVRDCELFSGGPVEPGRGFVLHSPDYHSESTLKVDSEISLTATLEVLRAIATGNGPHSAIIALGYSGWAGGQLEEEIAANGWLTAQCGSDLIFASDHDLKYERAMRVLGVDPLLLSSQAGHA